MEAVHAQEADSSKVNLKVGNYAEYQFKSTNLVFLNKSTIIPQNALTVTFCWTITEANETTVKLSLTVFYGNEYKFDTQVYVNLSDRNVFLPNGTFLGTTKLWAPPKLAPGQEVTMWNGPPQKIIGRVFDYGNITDYTPQGRQRVFLVEASGNITGGRSISINQFFDYTTGIMVNGDIIDEPATFPLNVYSWGENGQLTLTGTNIQLGPDLDSGKFSATTALLIAAIAAPIGVTAAVFLVDKKARKHRKKQK